MKEPSLTEATTKNLALSADIFPVKWEFKLRAFEIETNSSVIRNKLLNQLAYHLGRKLNSSWCNCEGELISDHVGDLPTNVLELVWEDSRNRFGDVLAIREVSDWKQGATHVSEIANTKFKQLKTHLTSKLESRDFGDANVQRMCYSQPIVIHQKPYLALSISSPINYKLSLAELLVKKPNLELLGLKVRDRDSGWPTGVVVEITGVLDEQTRSRLLSMTTKPKQREWIQGAEDKVSVVKIRLYNGTILEYASTGLSPIPSYGSLSEFGLNQHQISNYQRISSEGRRALLLELIRSSKLNSLLDPPIESGSVGCFRSASDIGYDGKVLVGNGQIAHISQNIRALKNHGFYRIHDKFIDNHSIRVGILNGIPDLDSEKFLDALSREFTQFGFRMELMTQVACNSNNYSEIERSLEDLVQTSPDIILSILPNRHFSLNEEFEGPYQNTKHLTINRGTMNQVVSKSTVQNHRFKLANIAVGMLAKVGNIPWVLPKGMEFCDRILGADISRKAKANQKGTRNELGVPRWYRSNGDLLNYRLTKAAVDGEKIPMRVIREITPRDNFSNSRILFHGDGKRPRDEIDDFLSRGVELDGEIMVVQVIKQSPFRMYSTRGRVGNPKKGDWVRISDTEAVVISTLAQHNTGTPHPLLIRSTPNITIENAVLSILQLSDLHYGSQQQPRCPITTHDAHHISKMLMMGIRPPDDEGTVPWWL